MRLPWKRSTGIPPAALPPSGAETARPGPAERDGAILGLSDADLIALFNLGQVRQLDAGETLFVERTPDLDIAILLTGMLDVRSSAAVSRHRVNAGQWIHLPESGAGAEHEETVVAHVPSSVLILDHTAAPRLNDRLQAHLSQRARRASMDRLRQLGHDNQRLHERSLQLADTLYRYRTASQADIGTTDLVQQILRHVPRMPVSSLTLLHKLLDEKTTQVEVAELVKIDPALTGLLLKAVNSPLYNLPNRIGDINHAINLLGFQSVYQIVLSESLRKTLPETEDFQQVLSRSLDLSRLAFGVALATGAAPAAELATIGMLHQIGCLVTSLLVTHNPKLARIVEKLDTAALGADLLRDWRLPERVCAGVQYQDYPQFATPERLPVEVRSIVAVLYLANRLCDRIYGRASAMPPIFLDDYLAVLGKAHETEESLLNQHLIPMLRRQRFGLSRSLAAALHLDGQ